MSQRSFLSMNWDPKFVAKVLMYLLGAAFVLGLIAGGMRLPWFSGASIELEESEPGTVKALEDDIEKLEAEIDLCETETSHVNDMVFVRDQIQQMVSQQNVMVEQQTTVYSGVENRLQSIEEYIRESD